jgi:hypothetical protein
MDIFAQDRVRPFLPADELSGNLLIRKRKNENSKTGKE